MSCNSVLTFVCLIFENWNKHCAMIIVVIFNLFNTKALNASILIHETYSEYRHFVSLIQLALDSNYFFKTPCINKKNQ